MRSFVHLVGCRRSGSSAVFGLAVAATILLAISLQAAPIVRLEAVADTFVEDGSGPQGALTTLIVRQTGSRVAYIKFTLSDFQKAYVTAAVFDVTMLASGGGFDQYNLYGLVDGDGLEDWSEATLQATTPEVIRTVTGDGARLVPIATVVEPNPGGTVPETSSVSSLSLFDFIQADSDGQITLLMFANGGAQGTYASKEHATALAPGLTLTLPEPASFTLLGLAGLQGLRRRRRSGGGDGR